MVRHRFHALMIGVVFANYSAGVHAATPTWDAHYQIHFTVPDGFQNSPEKCEQVHAAYVFVRPRSNAEPVPVAIMLKGMGGIIGREQLKAFNAPDGTPATVTTVPWKSFDISLAKVTQTVQGVKLMSFIAQVPIRKEALQVVVTGEAGHDAELENVLKAFLTTLDGPSNWLSLDERIGKGLSALGTLLGVAGVVWFSFLIKRRKATQ